MFNLISIKEIEIKQWDAFYSSEIADLNKMSLPKVMETREQCMISHVISS